MLPCNITCCHEAGRVPTNTPPPSLSSSMFLLLPFYLLSSFVLFFLSIVCLTKCSVSVLLSLSDVSCYFITILFYLTVQCPWVTWKALEIKCIIIIIIMTVSLSWVCVVLPGLSWVPWLLCTTGVQPHPAQSLISVTEARYGCRPAINHTHTTYPTLNWCWGESPASIYSLPHPSKQKKKLVHKLDSQHGYHTYTKPGLVTRLP